MFAKLEITYNLAHRCQLATTRAFARLYGEDLPELPELVAPFLMTDVDREIVVRAEAR